MPMKLTFFLQDFKGGGAQHMIVNTANEFAARGHDVVLLVVNDDGPHKDRVAETVRIENLGKNRSLAAIGAIAAYIYRQKPDVFVSAMTHSNIVAILSRLLVPRSGTRLVVTERTFLSRHIEETPSLRDKAFVYAVKIFYRFADKVIGISRGVADDIQGLAHLKPEKTSYIYNPVITSQMQQEYAEDLPALRDMQGQALIVTSGRLSFEKDQATLLRAFARVCAERDAKLLILGDGPLKQDLKDISATLGIADNVCFAGFVKNSLAYMKQADLFVITSLYEGFCNVIVEALYCGLPVVSTDAPSGPREILQNGVYGAIVPVGDSKALADAMLAALSKAENPEVEMEKQRRRAQDFTVTKICDQYEALFTELIGERRLCAA